jgi:hypothetical protein
MSAAAPAPSRLVDELRAGTAESLSTLVLRAKLFAAMQPGASSVSVSYDEAAFPEAKYGREGPDRAALVQWAQQQGFTRIEEKLETKHIMIRAEPMYWQSPKGICFHLPLDSAPLLLKPLNEAEEKEEDAKAPPPPPKQEDETLKRAADEHKDEPQAKKTKLFGPEVKADMVALLVSNTSWTKALQEVFQDNTETSDLTESLVHAFLLQREAQPHSA